jgi:hypothetical protein
MKLPTSRIYHARPGQLVRRVSSAIAAVLAMSAIAFSVTAREPDDGNREQRGDGHDRPQVWFAPNDDLPRPRGPDGFLNHDFPHLFDPNPAWDAKIDVFKISPMMGSTVGPAEELNRINTFLKDRRISLSVDTGGVTMDHPVPTPGECGFGVEGMIRPGRNAIAFKRLKQLGIEVAYATLDEPLTYGHYYNRKNACHYSIAEVARRTAAEVAEIHRFYPDARIVDVEAPQITATAQWNADLPTWLKAYGDAGGAPFDAVVFDMDWRQPWQDTATPGVRALRAAGVRSGIILDGTGPGASDAEALAAYKRNIQAVEATGLKFDLVMVANWTPHPSRNLPQSDPDTLTSVLAWYLQQHEVHDRNGAGR